MTLIAVVTKFVAISGGLLTLMLALVDTLPL